MKREKFLCVLLIVVFAIFVMGCENPMGPVGPPGEDGINGTDGVDGTDGEDGEDGEDGNANVTVYLFPGNDFRVNSNHTVTIPGLTADQWLQDDFSVFMNAGVAYYSLPGLGVFGDSEYRYYAQSYSFIISLVSGPGEDYPFVKVVHTEANNVVDNRSISGSTDLPEDFDELMEYYESEGYEINEVYM